MLNKKLELINDQASPLFRIMSVYDENDSVKRRFYNNICAFHIGNGAILSVAHNLIASNQLFESMEEPRFQEDILQKVDTNLVQLFSNCFQYDNSTKKRYLAISSSPAEKQALISELSRIKYDTRCITFNAKKIHKPFLIVQFENNLFYNDSSLTEFFVRTNKCFHEPSLNKYTFLIELEIVDTSYRDDIAMYKIVNTPQEIIDRIPKISPDFTVLDTEADPSRARPWP